MTDSDRSPSSRFNRVRDFLVGLSGGTTTLAMMASGCDPLLSLAAGGAVGQATHTGADAVLGAAQDAAADRARRAAHQLAVEMHARVQQADPGERRRIIDEYTDDPVREQTLFEAWKSLVATPDGAVWPALNSMGGDYWAEGRTVDGFFRDASTLFAQCDKATVNGIAAVLSVAMVAHRHHGDHLVNYNPPPESSFAFIERRGKETLERKIGAPRGVERALRLLRANGFCMANAHPHHFNMDPDGMENCKRLLAYAKLCDVDWHLEPDA